LPFSARIVCQASFAALELCDRAFRFVAERGLVSEPEMLAHVYGGAIPGALSTRLAAPLLTDGRLARAADGTWSLTASPQADAQDPTFTALALVATGPTPGRARLVRVAAAHVVGKRVVERFDVTLNPRRRVPRYVAERVGVEPEVLDSQPDFADVLDELARFLTLRPVLAQDVQLTWAFLDAEARRFGRILPAPRLLDVNAMATMLLNLTGKPSLGLVAARLGIGSVDINHPDEEARVLGLVGGRLLAMCALDFARPAAVAGDAAVLRRGASARALPDQPGVYVLRDREQTPLYVGKARRLRSRVGTYVHRPLGATRRLEGLVGAVDEARERLERALQQRQSSG